MGCYRKLGSTCFGLYALLSGAESKGAGMGPMPMLGRLPGLWTGTDPARAHTNSNTHNRANARNPWSLSLGT